MPQKSRSLIAFRLSLALAITALSAFMVACSAGNNGTASSGSSGSGGTSGGGSGSGSGSTGGGSSTATAPSIASFFSTPSSISQGSSANLTWSVSGAASVSIDNGIGVVTASSINVSPVQTTTYKLTATSATGLTATASTTVTVVGPAISSFTASHSSIGVGDSTTLSWLVSGAASLSIDNGVGTVSGSSISVSPAQTTTYMLTATDSNGVTSTAKVTVTVLTTPQITSFTATPASIPVGGSTSLYWSVLGADTITIDNGGGGTSTISTGSANVLPPQTLTYTLTATGHNGSVATAQVTVTVVASPVISSFAATPASIKAGDSTTLSWSATNAATVSIDNGVGTVTGTSVTVTPTKATTYTLTVANAVGVKKTAQTSVTIFAISSFTATTSLVTSGDPVMLSWSAPGAVSTSIDNGVGMVTGNNVVVHPSQNTTYTLTAVDGAGESSTAQIAVNVTNQHSAASIASFSTSQPVLRPVTIGPSSATLSWSASNAVSFTVDNGVGDVSGNSVSVSPAATTTYTLLAKDAAGIPAMRTVTVQVQSNLALLAGHLAGYGTTDGSLGTARFDGPNGLVFDSQGNLFVADSNNETIRKITPQGVVSTFAGMVGQGGWVDGAGTAAQFNGPWALAIDASDNLYVADNYNSAIRKITPAGVVSTLAGSPYSDQSKDGTGEAAQFGQVLSIASGPDGNIYAADSTYYTVLKITPAGVVTTIAGKPGVWGHTDGTGSAATFGVSWAIATDANNNVYLCDGLIRKISPAGVVTTIPLTVVPSWYANGLDMVTGMVVDNAGNMFVADTSYSQLAEVTPAGVVSVIAGSNAGYVDGTGMAAEFDQPGGLTRNVNGNFYLGDTSNNSIRKVTPSGVVTTVAGMGSSAGFGDGTGSAAYFDRPSGVATDPSGNVYVVDAYNNSIRKVTPGGVVTTFAGSVNNAPGNVDGQGAAASFYYPAGIASDHSGNLYVSNGISNTIRKIAPDATVTTLAGTAGVNGTQDGTGPAAQFTAVGDLTTDAAGNVYVIDGADKVSIRKVTPAGVVSTIATGLASPSGIAVSSNGTVYFTDGDLYTLNKLNPDGTATIVAGSEYASGHQDGTGTAAVFRTPYSLAIDAQDNLYVADMWDGTIRKVTPAGVVSTVIGVPGEVNLQMGPLPANVGLSTGIAIDAVGNLYISTQNGLLALVP